jgi:hypothetical protein
MAAGSSRPAPMRCSPKEHDRPLDPHDALVWPDQYRQVIEAADGLPTIEQKALPTRGTPQVRSASTAVAHPQVDAGVSIMIRTPKRPSAVS